MQLLLNKIKSKSPFLINCGMHHRARGWKMCNTREHLTASSGIVVEWMKNFLSLFLLLVATFCFPCFFFHPLVCVLLSLALSLSVLFFSCFFGYSFFSCDTFRHPHSPSLWLEGFQAVERENVLRFFCVISKEQKIFLWKLQQKN